MPQVEHVADDESIEFKDQFVIGENTFYKFAVGRLEDRWAGYDLGDMDDGTVGLFVLGQISEDWRLGFSNKETAILMTGAIAQAPEHGYGGILRWFVPERLRGKPEDFRCKGCEEIGCKGECEGDLIEEDDSLTEEYTGPDLVPCCVCEATGPQVRNILCLERESPIPEHGWACFACGAEGGASVVVCDDCMNKPLKFACRGYPGTEGRIPYEELTGKVEHDMTKHPEATANRN